MSQNTIAHVVKKLRQSISGKYRYLKYNKRSRQHGYKTKRESFNRDRRINEKNTTKLPSYFMSREDEITESIGDERDELINEIYFEYVSSETQDLFGFLDSLISEEDYNISDNVKQSLNEFKEGILNLRMEWNTYYYLDDLYEEYLSQLKNMYF